MEIANIEEAIAEYELKRPLYNSLCGEIQELIVKALCGSELAIAGCSARAKTIESFRDKISRKEYDDPLDQTEDLAGVRIICLYDDDRKRIADICTKEFEVLKYEDQGQALGADRMGYSGTHLVVRLGAEFSGGRYKGITELKCEIQIRTAVQDAWSMISHGMVYKRERDVPIALRRDLNHAATLLEIAQTKFDELRIKRTSYVHEISTEIAQDVTSESSKLLEREVNFDTLTAYIQWKFAQGKPDDKLTRMVINDLPRDRYLSIADIDEAVERTKPAVQAYESEAPELFRNGTDYITKSLGFADASFRNKHPFASKTRSALARFDHLVSLRGNKP